MEKGREEQNQQKTIAGGKLKKFESTKSRTYVRVDQGEHPLRPFFDITKN